MPNNFSKIFFVIHYFQTKDWAERHKRSAPPPEQMREANRTPRPSYYGYGYYGNEGESYYQNNTAQQYYDYYQNPNYGEPYQRPYDNNYAASYYSTQYPRQRYDPRMPPPPPPPPPRPRPPPPREAPPGNGRPEPYREASTDPSYRRESFSSFKDHPEKRSRKQSVSSRPSQPTVTERSRSEERGEKQRKYPYPKHSEDESSGDEQSDYKSEAESIESIITLLDRSTLKHREPREEIPMQQESCHSDGSEETEIPISEKEKKDYFSRLDLIYATLDEHLKMPEAKQKVSASLARGNVTVKAKPESLPASQFILRKFDEYHERAVNAIATVKVKKSKRDGEKDELVKVMSTTKPKLGFEKNPFNPRWLYKIDEAEWPDKVKTDDDITLLTQDNANPTETFELKRKELLQIQHATSLSMNASTHLDWLLTATKKIVKDALKQKGNPSNHLHAIDDLIEGAAYANEFITDQNIYIHGGITHTIRSAYVNQMEDLTTGEHVELLAQRYDAYATFNGQIPRISRDLRSREESRALKKSMRDKDSRPKKKYTKHKKSKKSSGDRSHMGYILQRNYGDRNGYSKAGPKSRYGYYDNHGTKYKNQKFDGQFYNQHPKQNQFQSSKKSKKNKGKSGYQGNKGGRNRDHN